MFETQQATIEPEDRTADLDNSNQKERFRLALLSAFEEETFEDGFSHPAEKIIEEALRADPKELSTWIQAIFRENINRLSIASGILRCIGRLNVNEIYPWGHIMVLTALENIDPEVREAAVRAAENWEDPFLIKALSDHEEEVPWLADYINQVVIDLLN